MTKSTEVTLNISDKAEVEAPPSSASDPSTNAAVKKLHPVMKIMQEKELGKMVFMLAVPIAMGTVVAGKDKLSQWEVAGVLTLTVVGFVAIFNGVLLKDSYPEIAQIVEAVGIVAVAVSFFSVISFFLPVELLWLPVICIVLCLVPFAIAVSQPSRS